MRKLLLLIVSFYCCSAMAQNKMTPELLWKLGRVSGLGISKDGKYILYAVSTPNADENKSSRKTYMIPVAGGDAIIVTNADSLLNNEKISADGKYMISDAEQKVKPITGADNYPELKKSNVYIFDNLDYRHWDTYEDGKFSHVMVAPMVNGKAGEAKDLMPGEPYDCPQKPFGGDEDYVWNPNGKEIVYCTKKEYGTAYAISNNTDLYAYNIETGKTKNLTEGMPGYDINPSFNQKGELAWLSMKRAGYEADKQDIIVSNGITKMNVTAQRDDIHVEGYKWSADGRKLFFWAPIDGTLQLFEVSYPGLTKMMPIIRQITKGDFDVTGIVGQTANTLIVSRTDMNHAAELFSVDINSGAMKQLTHVNDATYATLSMGKTERRMIKTTDGKDMLVWVIYPPDFDPAEKYPTLLYCQGGPQSALTQFYSFRWNFQLMAANGYIVVAPNRRGMPGHGTKWNEQISKDWGGQVMNDYLSAIDGVSKEKYVDKNRLGCVGASYGGYSVFYLAGIHNKRFKSFIAHDGVFDFRSMYGTTDEMWFENWDKGGPYWDKNNAAAQKSYTKFNPSDLVATWNTPILIYQGGKDYRVPIEQGQQAFQAAQLRGIKSKFILLPDQNHWVLTAQDALVWQHEFYKWLAETLK
ncbi:S9 family peptidase [Ferruginibacter sp. SUN106]|uniref:S9 family peptidase n=1 Tax=Ferruginibacter sp. SUN106 TaxID=2978348 RepID=UPI003D35C7FE